MIELTKNPQLDTTMKNLLLSMLDVNDYVANVLDYLGKILSSKMETKLLQTLKKYSIPRTALRYDAKMLTENPYYKNIKLNQVLTDTVKYENATIKKRTLMNMNFHQPMGKYLFHYHPIGYFEQDIHLPVLKEGNRVWMSPAVSEIESMRDGIVKGQGHCMTMGLGIGVLPYLWLLKPQVESVTIVEFNKDVIDLFETYIKPQFPTNKRLEIIHGNAFDYYTLDFLSQFDYVYVDFWESTEDGLPFYTKLMEQKVDFGPINYWIEDSILSDVKNIVVPYLYTLYEGKSVADFISSFDSETKVYAKKVNKYFKAQTSTISTEEQLLHIIHDPAQLREILAQ